MTTVPVTGGCLCGAIRFESADAPYEVLSCHCDMCKKAFGGIMGIFVCVRGEAFRFTRGKPKIRCSSDIAERAFCADCGTPIYMRYLHETDFGLMVGSLDHPEDWPPSEYHYCSDRMVPWLKLDDGLPRKPFDPIKHQKIVELVRMKLGQAGSHD